MIEWCGIPPWDAGRFTAMEAALMIKGQVERDRMTEAYFDTLALRLSTSQEQHKSIVEQMRLRDRYRSGEIQRKPGAE